MYCIPYIGVRFVDATMMGYPYRWIHTDANENNSPTYEVYCKIKEEDILAHMVITDQSKQEVKKMVSDLGYDITKINIAEEDES